MGANLLESHLSLTEVSSDFSQSFHFAAFNHLLHLSVTTVAMVKNIYLHAIPCRSAYLSTRDNFTVTYLVTVNSLHDKTDSEVNLMGLTPTSVEV